MSQIDISLEKVIKGLERCIPEGTCEECPYVQPGIGTCESLVELLKDAYVLLKAQEPVEPVVNVDTWTCGNCRHTLEHQQLLGDNVLFHEQYDYCPNCGKRVKWE